MWSSIRAIVGALAFVVAVSEARTIGDGGVNYLQSLVDTLGDEVKLDSWTFGHFQSILKDRFGASNRGRDLDQRLSTKLVSNPSISRFLLTLVYAQLTWKCRPEFMNWKRRWRMMP